MKFGTKILSREIQELLYDSGKTLCTAESCTGGRIAEAIIAVPGASNYFKGGIISYTNEVKERLLHVSHDTLEAHTAVSEEVAKEMVVGACEALNCDYAISATGVAGPTGGTPAIPVGTIWIGYGSKEDVRAFMLSEDLGRDRNLATATNMALRMFLDYLKEAATANSDTGQVPVE
jgi:nicotinamide-nucleotide amidase